MTLAAQAALDDTGQIRLVLDDQDAHDDGA
jgi:hypothetical protein